MDTQILPPGTKSMLETQKKTSSVQEDNNNVKQENLDCYKCKACRITLFKAIEISKHIIGEDRDESSCVNLNDKDLCHNEIYIKPQGWFEEKLSEMNGKINCPNPKCDTKIGSFDWCGSKCACGAWITPAFHITKSKVDLFRSR